MQGYTIQKLILICSLAYTLAACGLPVGHIGGGYSGIAQIHDDFWVVPRRQVYNLGDDFVSNEDLWPFASSRGMVQRVSLYDVVIHLVRNPDSATRDEPIVVFGNGNGNGNGYAFNLGPFIIGRGRKLIIVTYRGIKAEYSIEILDPYDLADDDDDVNGGGISIGW